MLLPPLQSTTSAWDSESDTLTTSGVIEFPSKAMRCSTSCILNPIMCSVWGQLLVLMHNPMNLFISLV